MTYSKPAVKNILNYQNLAVFTLQTLLCYIYLSLCSLKTFEAIHISQVTRHDLHYVKISGAEDAGKYFTTFT